MSELDEEEELLAIQEALSVVLGIRRRTSALEPVELPVAIVRRKGGRSFANMWSRFRCWLGFHSGREVHSDGFGVVYGYTPCRRCQK